MTDVKEQTWDVSGKLVGLRLDLALVQLAGLSRSELFVSMVAGLATISGNMLVVYATMIAPVVPDAAGQLLTASLVSAPGSILAGPVAFLGLVIQAVMFRNVPAEILVFTAAAAALLVVRHADNIERLRNGTENKLGQKARPTARAAS